MNSINSIINRVLSATSPFEILGIPVTASIKDIETSYRKLARWIHPDKCNHPQSTKAFILTEVAKNTLLKQRECDEQMALALAALRAKRQFEHEQYWANLQAQHNAVDMKFQLKRDKREAA